MAETVLIELGEVRDRPVVGPPPPSPRRRRVVAVALAVVLAGLAGGAAPAPVVFFTEAGVPAASDDFVTVQEDRLYVVGPKPHEPDVAGRGVTAYRLPDGGRLWSAALPVTSPVTDLYRAGGALMVFSHTDAGSEVVVLDERSGALRWRRQANLYGLVPGPPGGASRLLVGAAPGPESGPPYWSDRYEAVDLRTGAAAWSYRPPPGAQAWPVWRWDTELTTRMVTALPSGRAEVRDLATGAVVAAANVRPPGQPVSEDAPGPPTPALITDDDLVVAVGAPDDGWMTAYGLERLERRWTVPWDNGSPDSFNGSACGDLLCLVGFDGHVRALERDTGRVRWRAGWFWARAHGALLLVSGERGSIESQRLALVDPATGQTRRELGRWALTFGTSTVEILFRYDTGASRAWVGVLEPGIPDVQVLGWLGGVKPECYPGQGCVVCRRLDGSIGIWRYR